jgi:ABC-type antimicrobial peptide transport system permease subunit
MTFHDQIVTAFSNVGRRKLRSALASLGVLVGTLTIVIMVSLADGVRQQINRQFAAIGLDRLTVSPPGEGRGFGPPNRGGFNPANLSTRKQPITIADVARWRALPGVAQVNCEVNLPNSVALELQWNGTTQYVRFRGFDFRPAFFQPSPAPVAGSLELPESGGIVLSQGIVDAAGIATNDFAGVIGESVQAVLHTSRGESQSFNLRVKGISEDHSLSIQASLADRIAMKNWWFNSTNIVAQEGYDSVAIRATDVMEANDITAQIRGEGFHVDSLETFMTVANRIVTAITVMFTLIGGVALLVATIGIANTMVMAIYERTREIGILKAMGASSGEIRQMFMFEAGFIGFIGGALGLLLGWLVGLGLNQIIPIYLRHRVLPVGGDFFVVKFGLAVTVILFATFIGLLAGLLPAQRAANLDPLEALRHE